ncbi:MAG: hypothetical protein Fur0034_21750 [Desulfuromonadia bacterium]
MTTTFAIITTALRLPAARILLDSLRRHHPGTPLHILLCESPDRSPQIPVGGDEPRLTPPEIAPDGWLELAFSFDEIDFPYAMTPHLISFLLQQGYERVILLDPDFDCFAPLDRLTAPHTPPLTLLPLVTDPSAIDGRESLGVLLDRGGYHHGFLVVQNTPGMLTLLRWWQEAILFDPTPRLLSLFPGMIETSILRDPSYTLSHENWRSFHVHGDGDRITTHGAPLHLFRFPPFPGADRSADLRSSPLAQIYQRRLDILARSPDDDRPWSWGFYDSGEPISPEERRAYRLLDRSVRRSIGNPFQCGSDPQSPIRARAEEALAACDATASRQVAALHRQIEDLKERNEMLLSSLSWRITAPLRILGDHTLPYIIPRGKK